MFWKAQERRNQRARKIDLKSKLAGESEKREWKKWEVSWGRGFLKAKNKKGGGNF